MYIGVVKTDKRSTSMRARKMLVFVTRASSDPAVTRQDTYIHIYTSRKHIMYHHRAGIRTSVWCVLHVIIFGIVGENVGGGFCLRTGRFLARTIAYCADARKFGFDAGRRSISDAGHVADDLARLILYGRDKISRRVSSLLTC